MAKTLISEQIADKDRPELSAKGLMRCFLFLGRHSALIGIGSILCLICVWAEMSLIKAMGDLIDRPDLYTAPIWALVWPFLFYGMTNRVCGGIQWLITVYATNRATLKLRRAFFNKLQTLSKAFFDNHKIGWLVARNSSDINRINDFLTYPLMMIIIFFTTLGFAIMQIKDITPLMLIPMLVVSPLFTVITIYYRKRSRRAQRKTSEQNSRIVANISETVRGIKVVHAFSREEENFNTFDELNDKNRKLNISLAKLNGLFMPSLDFIGMLNMALVVGFSFWLINNGYKTAAGTPITAGDVAQYVMYMNAILHPLRMVTDVYGMSIAASAAAERVFEIMDIEPHIKDAPNAIDIPPLKGEIDITGLSFRYNDDQPWVLEDVELKIPAGQTLAIVGMTGAGKTTLASLIAHFYNPVRGSIKVDGHDLKEVTLKSYQSQLGFVPQQGYLFTGTVLDNLRFTAGDMPEEEIIAKATELGAHQTIMSLPQGYQTRVIEGGDGLSLGQRQIIAILRAVLADPAIMIMDEPTSSLDIYHERLVQKALETISMNRTTIVIAHRLSTVRNADQIIVIDKHHICEKGTHSELLARGGAYSKIYRHSLDKPEII